MIDEKTNFKWSQSLANAVEFIINTYNVPPDLLITLVALAGAEQSLAEIKEAIKEDKNDEDKL